MPGTSDTEISLKGCKSVSRIGNCWRKSRIRIQEREISVKDRLPIFPYLKNTPRKIAITCLSKGRDVAH